jgi:ATP-dependent protease ClpP protease subunit
MAKEVLLYGRIDSYSANEFHDALKEIEGDGEMLLRINSEGGSPEYAWGIISMWNEIKTPKKIRIDGQAHSSAAFILCYAENAEGLDVSEYLIHRAAYPSYMENSEDFPDSLKGNLERINKSLETAFRAKVDIVKFESLPQMAGLKTKDIFSMDGRIDIFLTAKEAKSIGLINKVIPLTPSITAEISSYAKAASSKVFVPREVQKEEIQKPINKKQMTADQLKSEHPETYNAIAKSAVDAERDRVGAWMAFNDIDAVAVAKGITEGKSLSQTDMADFTRKGIAKGAVANAETEKIPAVEATETKTAEQLSDEAKAKKTTDFLTAAKEAAKTHLK